MAANYISANSQISDTNDVSSYLTCGNREVYT